VAELKKEKALVPSQIVELPESACMSVATFRTFVQIHDLSQGEVGMLVEMIEEHQLSVPYVGKLLNSGSELPHINAAYLLRNELGTLYDPNRGRGRVTSEFTLPVDKACQLLARMYRVEECDEDESVEAAARLLCEVADRCPQIDTWATVMESIIEVFDPLSLAIEERVGDLLDLPPIEKVEMMIAIIDELQLIEDRRL
jgi:hypothetical protein